MQLAATVTLRRAPEAKPPARPEVFQAVYGLTKAEARLAALLAEGQFLGRAALYEDILRFRPTPLADLFLASSVFPQKKGKGVCVHL